MAIDPTAEPDALDLSTTPGHLIRRAQQVHTAYWAEELDGLLTGPQYAVVVSLAGWPGISQTRLGELASLDKNTAAGILTRLERRGWVERVRDPGDARRRVLRLTGSVRTRLRTITPAATRVQERLLGPLPPGERQAFVSRLARVAFQQRRVTGYEPESATGPVLSLPTAPGYLIRRGERVHGELWTTEVGGELTAPQYALLVAVLRGGEVDQRQAGELASLDKSSTADVVSRLERRGLVRRYRDSADGRRWLLELTSAARDTLGHITPAVARVQERLLEPLPAAEWRTFTRQLARVAYQGTPPTLSPSAPPLRTLAR
ncbi:MarR family winged helix-turn-helix transcriptional regulator [Amycolatopsis tucumanensis]|uniref:MarR family winged helix-turn-helix transcriptional regulator n=1 Tax=Amycolatopsis tucumanensis TaxID=401106 RepID=UPI003D71EAB1